MSSLMDSSLSSSLFLFLPHILHQQSVANSIKGNQEMILPGKVADFYMGFELP